MMGGPQRIAHDTAEALDPLDFISKGLKRFVSLISKPETKAAPLPKRAEGWWHSIPG